MTMAITVNDLVVERDRRHRFYHTDGQIACDVKLGAAETAVFRALENGDIPFPAPQHDLFVDRADAAEGLALAAADTCLKTKQNIIAQVELIEAVVVGEAANL